VVLREAWVSLLEGKKGLYEEKGVGRCEVREGRRKEGTL
jgi:hypothetical protein